MPHSLDSILSGAMPSRRSILSQLPAASIAMGATLGSLAPVTAGPQGDAELLRLGREFEAAWSHEIAVLARLKGVDTPAGDEEFDAAIDAVSAIVDRIEVIPATSLAGLQVKARAISWCHSGEPLEAEAFSDQQTTNVRIAASLVNDLLAMGGAA